MLEPGIGWYFNRFFPHTEIFGRFISNSIETGLVDAWRRKTWRGMRKEYFNSQEDKIVLPDEDGGGLTVPQSHLASHSQLIFSEKPLRLADLQGGFYLLGMGISLTFIIHFLMIMKTKLLRK